MDFHVSLYARQAGKTSVGIHPPTFLMHHEAGMRMARIVPRMEEKAPRATRANAFHSGENLSKNEEKDKKAGIAPHSRWERQLSLDQVSRECTRPESPSD